VICKRQDILLHFQFTKRLCWKRNSAGDSWRELTGEVLRMASEKDQGIRNSCILPIIPEFLRLAHVAAFTLFGADNDARFYTRRHAETEFKLCHFFPWCFHLYSPSTMNFLSEFSSKFDNSGFYFRHFRDTVIKSPFGHCADNSANLRTRRESR
jgi:hypothetical protein